MILTSHRMAIASASSFLFWFLPEIQADDLHFAEGEAEPADAILFPWFFLAVSVLVYYFLSRYARWLPYTGMCFLLG